MPGRRPLHARGWVARDRDDAAAASPGRELLGPAPGRIVVQDEGRGPTVTIDAYHEGERERVARIIVRREVLVLYASWFLAAALRYAGTKKPPEGEPPAA